MTKLDEEWIKFIHCLLWRLGEIDEWFFHRILYELSRENIVDIDKWIWFGEWPRSSLLDAVIALFTMSGIVKNIDGKLIIRKEPGFKCIFENRVEEVVNKVLNKHIY